MRGRGEVLQNSNDCDDWVAFFFLCFTTYCIVFFFFSGVRKELGSAFVYFFFSPHRFLVRCYYPVDTIEK